MKIISDSFEVGSVKTAGTDIDKLMTSISLLISFVIWTILLKIVDVAEVGPKFSEVGFSTLNVAIDKMFEFNETLFRITDYLMYTVILAAAVFGIIGLIQWIKRKSFLKVDHQILLLGASYIIVIAVYFLFELIPINYRPVLFNSELELSYPSSHTMTALFVFLSAIPMVNYLVKNKTAKIIINVVLSLFAAFTVIGRFICGAHWFTDIIGGCLFAIGLLFLFLYFIDFIGEKKAQKQIANEEK